MESVYHYGQLFGLFGADAFLHRTGMRPMRNTARVQGDHTPRNVLTAHEIAIHIIKQLITVYIAVVIGSGDGLGVIIKEAGAKRAYHIIIALKSLVYRRRLMHTACNGFKIMDAESKGITATIPAHHIKRVMPIM